MMLEELKTKEKILKSTIYLQQFRVNILFFHLLWLNIFNFI